MVVATYIRLNVDNQKASSILNAQNQGSFLAAMANGKGEFLFKVFFFLTEKMTRPGMRNELFFFLALTHAIAQRVDHKASIACHWGARHGQLPLAQ